MAIEINANNPLGLTVAGPGYGNPDAILYPGQSGATTSGLGYTFATFPDAQTGISAGIGYILDKIRSGAVSTVQGLVGLFSPNDLAAFTQTTGLGPGATLDPSQAGLYAAGIAAGEGTLGAFGGVGAFTGSPSAPGKATAVGGAPGAGGKASSGNDPLGVNKIIAGFETWVGSASMSVVFVILGIVLVGGALIMFANDTKAGDVIVKTAHGVAGAVETVAEA